MVLATLLCAGPAAGASQQNDRKDISDIFGKYVAAMLSEDVETLGGLTAGTFRNDGYDKSRLFGEFASVFGSCQYTRLACDVKSIEVAGDYAKLTVEGDMKYVCGEKNGAAECGRAFDRIGITSMCRADGKWLVCGNGQTGVSVKTKIIMNSFSEAMLYVTVVDRAGIASEAFLEGPGLKEPMPLSPTVEGGNEAFTHAMPLLISPMSMAFPIRLTATCRVDDEMQKIDISVDDPKLTPSRIVSPESNGMYGLPVNFQIEPPVKGVTGERVELFVSDINGDNVYTGRIIDGDSLSVQDELRAGDLYFAYTSRRIGDNEIFSEPVAFRVKGFDDESLALKYTFTDPYQSYSYSGDGKKHWITMVAVRNNIVVARNESDGSIDFIDAATMKVLNSYLKGEDTPAFCAGGGSVYLYDAKKAKILIMDQTGSMTDEWQIDPGASGTLCDVTPDGIILLHNTRSGMIELYDRSHKMLSAFTVPDNTASFAIGADGVIYISTSQGRVETYSASGEKTGVLEVPDNIDPTNGILVFRGGKLSEIIDMNLHRYSGMTDGKSYSSTIRAGDDGSVYVSFTDAKDCNICNMTFDLMPGGKVLRSNMFR